MPDDRIGSGTAVSRQPALRQQRDRKELRASTAAVGQNRTFAPSAQNGRILRKAATGLVLRSLEAMQRAAPACARGPAPARSPSCPKNRIRAILAAHANYPRDPAPADTNLWSSTPWPTPPLAIQSSTSGDAPGGARRRQTPASVSSTTVNRRAPGTLGARGQLRVRRAPANMLVR
jgi:hypothetical protein